MAPPPPANGPASPPVDAALEVGFHLRQVARVRPRREVLPAAVRQQRHDRASLQLARHAGRHDHDRARRRAGDPLEACGLIVGDRAAADGGRALRFEPTRNRAASRYLYEIDPGDLLRLTIATDDADEVFWAIVHSHTHTPAVPSPTDRRLAFYPDALYILVSLAAAEVDPATGAESVRAWRVLDGEIWEVALRIEA